MKFNQNRFLSRLSGALDSLEMNYRKDVTHHHKKVAYIADCLSVRLGLDEDDRLDLAACALLHDSGFSSFFFDIAKKRCPPENISQHCVYSQQVLEAFPLRKPREDILFYHHEYIDGSGFFGIDDPDLLSQIIRLADDIEAYHAQNLSPQDIKSNLHAGKKFSSELIEAFDETASHPGFWLELSPLSVEFALEKRLPDHCYEKSWADIRKFTHVFSGIIDKKSIFTVRHSSGLSEKAERMAGYYGFDTDKSMQFIIAANLHDLGKLAIPSAILDKPGRLTDDEFAVVQQHVYYTRRILEGIDGFEQIAEWAGDHHERNTGQGYPFGKKELSFESMLLATLDTYQALTEERPHRRGLLHQEAMDIITPIAQSGGFDPQITADIDQVLND